ncbi:MAG: transcription termination/antitermination protein NusG [Deltaproteobacteria bacterium]|nr:transcription termination/antitermination protein NusG [Deltaproteobacteria bacterium]MBW1953173.1 transcription termination/antitermination protein NusG [Deltaproteobacteria bacterium]MBW1987377.1 transcription termination/antitermination protein NusG [Deltaproteobacteria bacterium]MBW2135525.1 transcription termination/antitermination protein NusG [Deltaproteobacteria bacterium]
MTQKWYIVHTYSGFEKQVKQSLEERARVQGMENLITEILVPTEQVEEIVKGEKRISSRKFYPGYIMVRMELNDDTWHLVNDTPKVTGFLGSRTEPVAIADAEAEKILTQMREGALKPKPKVKFEVGDKVRVIEGPFSNFSGLVDEVKAEKGRVRVMISVFGRSTPVEFEFFQLEKI